MNLFLKKSENILYFLFLLVVICLNIYGSIFIVSGKFTVLFKNQIIPFIIAGLLIVLLFTIYKKSKNKLTTRQMVLFIIGMNVFALVFRFILNYSFAVSPTKDQYAVIESVNQLVLFKDISSLWPGGYFGINAHLTQFYYLFIFQAYYLNSIILDGITRML